MNTRALQNNTKRQKQILTNLTSHSSINRIWNTHTLIEFNTHTHTQTPTNTNTNLNTQNETITLTQKN